MIYKKIVGPPKWKRKKATAKFVPCLGEPTNAAFALLLVDDILSFYLVACQVGLSKVGLSITTTFIFSFEPVERTLSLNLSLQEAFAADCDSFDEYRATIVPTSRQWPLVQY